MVLADSMFSEKKLSGGKKGVRSLLSERRPSSQEFAEGEAARKTFFVNMKKGKLDGG